VLRLIAKAWGLTVRIRPTEAKDEVNRTLVPTLKRADLEQQLNKLHAWYGSERLTEPTRQTAAEATAGGRSPGL
jgi:hypothetical protein